MHGRGPTWCNTHTHLKKCMCKMLNIMFFVPSKCQEPLAVHDDGADGSEASSKDAKAEMGGYGKTFKCIAQVKCTSKKTQDEIIRYVCMSGKPGVQTSWPSS